MHSSELTLQAPGLVVVLFCLFGCCCFVLFCFFLTGSHYIALASLSYVDQIGFEFIEVHLPLSAKWWD